MARLIKKAKQYGFTLVELLIVVAIIGVLSTIGIPSFRRMVQKSKKSEAKVGLGGLYTSEQAFFSEYGGFGNHLARMGFNLEGNQQNMMYAFGFTAANCTSIVLNAASTLPAAANPIGAAITQAFPQYYIGVAPTPYAARSNQDVTPAVIGSSSMGNRILTQCAVPATMAAQFVGMGVPAGQAGNNVYTQGAAEANRFVAAAYGVIAPGISKTVPAIAEIDVWAVNDQRTVINVQDGVLNN